MCRFFFNHKFNNTTFVPRSVVRLTRSRRSIFVLSRLPSPGRRRDSDPSVADTEMASVVLEFKSSAGDSEPPSRPVLIIGQLVNLQKVGWNQIKGKLQPGVSKEVLNMQPRPLLANRLAEVKPVSATSQRENKFKHLR